MNAVGSKPVCLGMAEFFKGKTQSSVDTLSRGEGGGRGDCSLKVMPKSPQLTLNISLCSTSPLPKIKSLLHENNCQCSLAFLKKDLYLVPALQNSSEGLSVRCLPAYIGCTPPRKRQGTRRYTYHTRRSICRDISVVQVHVVVCFFTCSGTC